MRCLLPVLALTLVFCTQGLPIRADDCACSGKLPPSIPSSKFQEYYPIPAKRAGIQGRVLLELSVTEKGDVTNVVVLAAEPKGVFEESAKQYATNQHFNVGDDWHTSGARRRFQVGFLYLLSPRPKMPRAVDPYAVDNSVVITANRASPGLR